MVGLCRNSISNIFTPFLFCLGYVHLTRNFINEIQRAFPGVLRHIHRYEVYSCISFNVLGIRILSCGLDNPVSLYSYMLIFSSDG